MTLQVVVILINLLFVGLALNACSTAGIRKDKQIPLVNGQPQTGKYETVDFTLEFQYTYQPGGDSHGEMDFNASLRRSRSLASLDIWISFMDDEGKLMDRRSVYGSGAYKGVANRSFEVKFKVPPGTTNFGFTSLSQEQRERR